MPFGAGPRTCVGLHFSSLEGSLLLALIGRHYDLELAQDKVEPHLMVTLRPKGGIRMTLQPRKVPVASPAKLPVPNTGELS
jgi:cytochrome P450